jgi:hypothetical protein
MIAATTGPPYHVVGEEPQLVTERLDAAEKLAQQWALTEGRHGILVTRHAPSSFTVTLSAEVPYGTTQERDLA